MMKRFFYSAVIAMGCTIAVAAQAPTPDQAKPKDTMAKESKDTAKTVTATGCVAESGGHYMLNNATTADQTTPMTVALSGGSLKAHVGHKVEITGTMAPAKKDTMAKESKEPKKDDMAAGPTLNVKNVKMVAATCS
jgi:hypothetical protein